jgi:hypothetical protein
VCFGGWNVELSPRSLVSQPVMEVIDQVNLVDTTGPTQRDLEQMAQRDIQMAAYLATNPDPVTGLPQRQAQEFPRPPREQDRYDEGRYDDVNRNRPYQYESRSDADRILQYG